MNQLLSALRTRSESETKPLIQLIRQDASINDIEAYLTQHSENRDLASMITHSPHDDGGVEQNPGAVASGTNVNKMLVDQPMIVSYSHSTLRREHGQNVHVIRDDSQKSTKAEFSLESAHQHSGERLPGPRHLAFLSMPDGQRESDHQNLANDQYSEPGTIPTDVGNYVDPGAVRSFGNLPMSSAIRTNGWPDSVQQQQLNLLNKPQYLCPPLLLEEENGRDSLSMAAFQFRDQARSMIARGMPSDKVLSLEGLNTELMFRDRQPDELQTVSTWACEFTKLWKGLISNVCLYASVEFVSSFMRWFILPCRETWLAMPEFARPVVDQLIMPHHTLFVDLCHLPQLRSSLLNYKRDFVKVMRYKTFDCHWPHGDDACLEAVEGTIPSRLSSSFLTHINDMRNWSLHKDVLIEFPELHDQIRLHD